MSRITISDGIRGVQAVALASRDMHTLAHCACFSAACFSAHVEWLTPAADLMEGINAQGDMSMGGKLAQAPGLASLVLRLPGC